MLRPFLTKMLNWEFWPFWLIYLPVFPYYLFLSLKHRSPFFFSASNPSIEHGGMFGERKSLIFDLIPPEYYPATFNTANKSWQVIRKEAQKIGYPLIIKPDVGERGLLVSEIPNEADLKEYLNRYEVDFLLQEKINLPLELGIFYVRMPDEDRGQITSIVRKGFLKVVGDGFSTVEELLKKNPRALLQANWEGDFLRGNSSLVLPKNQELLIEPIGNHCRGTVFFDDNEKITDSLTTAFDQIARQIPDFYFGRFDLKCKSYDSLSKLQDFKILELNGAGSEPGHIYQPGYSLFKAYHSIFQHLRLLSKISRINHKKGVPYSSLSEGFRNWKSHSKYVSLLSRN